MYLGHLSLWVDGAQMLHMAPWIKALSTMATATASVLVCVCVYVLMGCVLH